MTRAVESYTVPTGKDFLPGTTKRSLASMRNKEPEERFRRHFDAAIMRKDGRTVGEIAENLGIHPYTAINWLRRMEKMGGLGEGYKTRQGNPPAFTTEQLKELERDMKKPPQHYGLDSETWTSRTVAKYAFDKFGITVASSSMRRILTTTKTNWPGSAAATLARRRGEPYP